MTEKTGKTFDLQIFMRIMKFSNRYRLPFFVATFSTILLSLFATARPYILIETVNDFTANKNLDTLLFYILIMLAVLLIETALQFIFIFYANWVGQHIIKDIRLKIFRHILQFKMAYFDKNSVGKLVTRVVSDIETIASFFSQGLFMIVSDLLKMLVVVVVMFFINWKLTLVVLSVLPILIYATKIFQKAIKATFQQVRIQVANLNSFVQERITGMKIVQLFNREGISYGNFMKINDKHKKAYVKAVWYYSIFFPIAEILSSVAIGLLVWYGGLQVLENKGITLGIVIGFIKMAQLLFRPLRQIADKFNQLQMGIVAGERIFKILDTQDSIAKKGTKNIELGGKIEFKDVHFSYIESEPVLRGISFSVKEGQTVAIVGATGAGKSTIINLINRFYEIDKGQISIADIPLEDYDLESLRNQISVVLQDVFLFSDSILNNVTLKNEDISIQAVEEIAKEIGIHDFIMSLPGGYNYNVKERGGMLSFGQRQLIAFLRAYVSNPRILILDEATSSVDTHSEQMIQYAIDKITQNRTAIIIAHRLATIKNADEIIVMDKGLIVERGSHRVLLSKETGYYKKLYEKQFDIQSV